MPAEQRLSLRLQLAFALSLAFLCGLTVAGVWAHWESRWRDWQAGALEAGIALHAHLTGPAGNGPAPFSVTPLQAPLEAGTSTPADSAPLAPAGWFETAFSFLPAPGSLPASETGGRISFRIYSPRLHYPLSTVESADGGPDALRFARTVKVLATFCGDPQVFVHAPQTGWVRIGGKSVWGCEAAPSDYRLPALLVAGLLMAAAFGWAGAISARLSRLSSNIEGLAAHGQTGLLETSGPPEIAAIAAAANNMLRGERERIARRAAILSGISHDLGTPAARLRMRAALIGDQDLRRKFESDIDRMTEMTDSVLSFARNEMEAEPLREVSVAALLTAIADDYADAGEPVTLEEPGGLMMEAPRSIFQSSPRQQPVPLHDRRRLLMACRPQALRRAIANLVDNALKYGGAAHLRLESLPGAIAIHVEDKGSHLSPEELERLVEPFQRGGNARARNGVGLGLTIVDSVARLHGGRLSFTALPEGTRATLEIRAAPE